MNFFSSVSGADALKQQLRDVTDRALKSTEDAVELSTRMLLIRMQNRLYPATIFNIQDHEQGGKKGRTRAMNETVVATLNRATLTGEVEVRPHEVKARSAAARGVLSRHLGEGALQREGLWLRPNARGTGIISTHEPNGGGLRSWARGRTTRSGLTYFEFAAHPKLSAWAQRRERGYQVLRHTIRVDNPEALLELFASPVLERSRAEIEHNLATAALNEFGKLGGS